MRQTTSVRIQLDDMRRKSSSKNKWGTITAQLGTKEKERFYAFCKKNDLIVNRVVKSLVVKFLESHGA